MEKIDTDYKRLNLKSLAKLFKPFNRDWAPLNILYFVLYPMNLRISGPEGHEEEGIKLPKTRNLLPSKKYRESVSEEMGRTNRAQKKTSYHCT